MNVERGKPTFPTCETLSLDFRWALVESFYHSVSLPTERHTPVVQLLSHQHLSGWEGGLAPARLTLISSFEFT